MEDLQIHVHYEESTGEIIGAYHSNCLEIPLPCLILSIEEWNILSTYNSKKVDLTSKVVIVDSSEIKERETRQTNIDRQLAYASESDVLFWEYQDRKITWEEWQAKKEEIKRRYPKVN